MSKLKSKKSLFHFKKSNRKQKGNTENLSQEEWNEKKKRKALSYILLVLAYLLLFGSFYWFYENKVNIKRGISESSRLSLEETKDLERMTMMATLIYRHQIGYPDFCRKNGYDMTLYPQVFTDHFQSEINILDQALRQKGSSLEDFIPRVSQKLGVMLDQIIEAEMIAMQKQMELISLIDTSRKNRGMPQEGVSSLVSSKKLCQKIDENAQMILTKYPSADFEQIRSLAQKIK